MKHLHTLTRMPQTAQTGDLSVIENIVLVLMSIFFQGWDNFGPAINGLRKFYQKTPD